MELLHSKSKVKGDNLSTKKTISMRHTKPLIDSSVKIKSKQLIGWIEQYNRALKE